MLGMCVCVETWGAWGKWCRGNGARVGGDGCGVRCLGVVLLVVWDTMGMNLCFNL